MSLADGYGKLLVSALVRPDGRVEQFADGLHFIHHFIVEQVIDLQLFFGGGFSPALREFIQAGQNGLALGHIVLDAPLRLQHLFFAGFQPVRYRRFLRHRAGFNHLAGSGISQDQRGLHRSNADNQGKWLPQSWELHERVL